MRLTSNVSGGRDILVLFLLVTFAQNIGGQPVNKEEAILLRKFLGNLKEILQPQQTPDGPPASEDIAMDTAHAQGHSETSQHLQCTTTDFFPVLGSCRDFYYCLDATEQGLEWSTFRFSCPQGLIFDVDSKDCKFPSLVTGRPECQSEKTLTEVKPGDNEVFETGTNKESFEAYPFDGIVRDTPPIKRRERRSTAVQCSNEEDEDSIENNAQEPCTDFNNIDNYITRLSSMNSSELPTFVEELYKGIIEAYNRDLEIAQDNANDWRHNSNVLNSIKETISLAKEFRPKFIREFEMNLKGIGIIIDDNIIIDAAINEELKPLRAKMERLSELQSTGQDPESSISIENNTKAIGEHLIRREREYHEAQKKYEIPKLISFLEMVRNDAVQIKTVAEDAESKIGDLEKNIIQDMSKFKGYQTLLKEGIVELEMAKDEKNKEISNIQNEIIKLNKQISDVNEEKGNVQENLRNLGIRDKRAIDPASVTIYILTIWASYLLGKDVANRESKATNVFRRSTDLMVGLELHINTLEAQIQGFSNEIAFANHRLSTMQEETEDLDNVIAQFSPLNGIFQSLQDEVNYIKPSVKNVKNGILKIKGVFEEIILRFEGLISQAKTAKTDTENENTMYLLYNEMSVTKCIWNKLSDKMIFLGGCAL